MAYIPWRYGITETADRPGRSKLNPTEIEFSLRDLVAKPYEAETFAFDLIGILNASKMTISRLRTGAMNKAKRPGDLLWQSRLFFRSVEPGQDVVHAATAMLADPLALKNKPRFVIATDGDLINIRDTRFDETEIVEFGRLDEKSDFLLPLAGYERRAVVEEHPADIKAAKKLKKLYDAILAANPTWSSGHHTHELNLLMTRLLFCFYAEKTGIFTTPAVFTDAVTQHTYQDPAAVAPLLDRLFRVMNVEEKARPASTPTVDARFPYVNGSLFGETAEIPTFDVTARRQLLECGDLDWTDINPDIFGSMIQTIAQDGTRSDLGMHYTSVPNIMKVLQPLFLDELHEAFEKAKDSTKKLDELLVRLSQIRLFDPACGSGNFLVIAYKALRDLETRILLRIGEIQPNTPLRLSGISLQHFYGIDVVDFACETTKLSLWIAEHQTNSGFQKIFGTARPTLPLAKILTIHCGNALSLDWLAVCPRDDTRETFICGNPPYQGLNNQSKEQRADIVAIVSPILRGDTKVDYVACWLVKLADYITLTAQSSGALVATNSICQGEQVAFLWPYIFAKGLSILFAHTSFKWANSASNNAGVTCIIVGIGEKKGIPSRLYTDTYHVDVPNINAYLIPSEHNIAVLKQKMPLSALPLLDQGSQAIDGGNLFVTPDERKRILSSYPQASTLFRRYYGAQELLHSEERFTLWISDEQIDLANSIPAIADHVKKVAQYRVSGGQHARRFAERPYRFAFIKHQEREALAIPQISSEERPVLQVGLIDSSEIAGHTLYVLYNPPAYMLSLLSSRMHHIWTQAIAGKLETRVRYSESLIYNTFPVPMLSAEQQRILADYSRRIIKTRTMYPGKSLAWLYNPGTMPADLLTVHKDLDEYLEANIYGNTFKDDNQRLARLFAMYARLRERAERDGTLFATAVKERG
jgi:hypothetical protein